MSIQLKISPKIISSIATLYNDTNRIFMEYIDNALDSAESYFIDKENTYTRKITINLSLVGTSYKDGSVTIEDNCTGITKIAKVVESVGYSDKSGQFTTNGQFGFGMYSFIAACEELKIFTKFENNNCLPILSSITFLDDCEKPFLISDININDYKYKFFEKNKSLLFIPNKMTHYIFKGNYYFYNFNNNGFVINIWKKTDKLDFKIYNNKNYLYENDIINYVLKKNIIKPIEIYYNNHILYEHLLYNDDNNIDFINIIEKNKYYIINNSIKNDLVQSNDNINRFSKIQKVKFI